ncbi:MAG TPA: RNA polymerase sigma-70 factor [Verrucomicrobiae bacterium]
MMIEPFNEQRALLFGIAYRMLGRVSEAEDMVQEIWLRWQARAGAEIVSPKAWLVAAMTRLCIDQLRSARREREEYYGIWLPEPLMAGTERSSAQQLEMAESLTMAFMLMLERLEPVERAVFLLREVFDYDYDDIAAMVGKTEVNCRQIVRRAKQELQGVPPAPAPPTAQARRVVEQFMTAAATGEVKGLLALLTDDAVLYSDGGGRVSAAGRPILTADRVSRFLAGIRSRQPVDTAWQLVAINGCPGILMSSGGQIYNAVAMEICGERVKTIYIIRNPEKLKHLATGR